MGWSETRLFYKISQLARTRQVLLTQLNRMALSGAFCRARAVSENSAACLILLPLHNRFFVENSYVHHYEFNRKKHHPEGSFVQMAANYTAKMELSQLRQRIKELSRPGAVQVHPEARNGELQVLTLGSYRIAGMHTFELNPTLAQMLLRTSLKDVPSAALKLPYQAIYIALTGALDGPIQLWGGEDTGWHDLAGMYIVAIDAGFFVWAWGAPNERSANPLDDAGLWFVIEPGVEDLETWLEDTYAPERVQERVKAAPGTWSQLARLFANTCLYLASRDAELIERLNPDRDELLTTLKGLPKKGQRRERAQALLKRLPRFYQLFPSLHIDERSGPILHGVRGHWRHAWVGPGRTVQELIWIRPHLRGGSSLHEGE